MPTVSSLADFGFLALNRPPSDAPNVRIQRTAKAQLLTVRWNDLLGVAEVGPLFVRKRQLIQCALEGAVCSIFDTISLLSPGGNESNLPLKRLESGRHHVLSKQLTRKHHGHTLDI